MARWGVTRGRGCVADHAVAGATVGTHSVVTAPPDMTDPQGVPDNDLTINIARATGGTGNSGLTVTFDFSVNEYNASTGEVIDAASGNTPAQPSQHTNRHLLIGVCARQYNAGQGCVVGDGVGLQMIRNRELSADA